MVILRSILLVVEVAVAILLIGIILIQKTKEQGLGLAFGSGMGEALFGSQAANVLTKVTIVLAIIFLLNTTILHVVSSSPSTGSVLDDISDEPAATSTDTGGFSAIPPVTDEAEPVSASVPAP